MFWTGWDLEPDGCGGSGPHSVYGDGRRVSGLLANILPRKLALAGIVIAVVAELGLLTILTDAANPLLPIARFASLVFLIAAAATMRLPAARIFRFCACAGATPEQASAPKRIIAAGWS